ncbi:hypothetical protein NW759_009297 [Fusarium solani]|uniref:Zn(2)-C6 fungal-type domain-containing protein n=2 Tax=Fusarium solani TaxID=169388 RepID=A0A9P9GWR4_FUSSL|nr:uncharacterized protein B0J15DRAFT_76640 [Fusarium solani]KAH7246865.1 hypothetical protein B0J15DRAFT_76640 [Fusarium solani]KAJ4216724.1 hypothetical protein NW759_009297 [Fusarium solani]
MTKGQGIRQYRACVRCRSRKTRCDLGTVGEPGKPPCAKCLREGAECVLAGSRRGGDFSHLRRPRQQAQRRPETALSVSSSDHVSPRQTKAGEDSVHDKLQNPSDALMMLCHAAGEQGDDDASNENQHTPNGLMDGLSNGPGAAPSAYSIQTPRGPGHLRPGPGPPSEVTVDDYPLVKDRTIDPILLVQLLRHYADNYHHFFPIVPIDVLRPEYILDTIRDESFLLTAILVVASTDRPDLADMHKAIWDHMRGLILNVVLGMASVRKVGTVEGLLLMGEWTLHNQSEVDDGDEASAWSIVGLAVRLAYLLRLEDRGFKGNDADLDSVHRERLAWTFTYLSDRQISIRMGQAFWCRGPALSARFMAHDFPALQPRRARDEDFASFIQAQVELTTLFGNAHDILFASRSRTAELMTRGDYTKYVDDATKAMHAWQLAWTSLAVSPHLKSCLSLMQEYLRLYVNAFAFQAVIYRASVTDTNSDPSNGSRPSIIFPDSAMASPDARHIYEAADAAEALIRIVTDDIDPVKHLRYMPARFYLYEIHSSVFLYKAHACGAISSGKHVHTASLMERFISVLKTAAVDESHIAARYARLLDRLWFRRAHRLASVDDSQSSNPELRNPGVVVDTLSTLADLNGGQMPFFDDLGLQPFDCTDTMDGLFAMPSVVSWDPSSFLNTMA